MHIRNAVEEDASALKEFFTKLYRESDFLLLTPEEYQLSTEQQRHVISKVFAAGGLIAIAEEGEIAGVVQAARQSFSRTRHIATLALGVLNAYAGYGIGGQLLALASTWAQEAGVARLELSVDIRNVRAIQLYERAGFRHEGTRAAARKIGTSLLDELYMAKTFPLIINGKVGVTPDA